MTRKPGLPPPLRAVAEARLAHGPASGNITDDLLHELQVHQIELEMQNDALRQAQLALEESRDHYVDLYEFAPVGYLTLSRNGQIKQVNLTGAELLGEERRLLLGRRFARFVMPEDEALWNRLFVSALQNGERLNGELALVRADGAQRHVRVDCRRLLKTGAEAMLRISLTDISERKRAEEELRIAAAAFEAQTPLLVTDAQGVIVRVNQACVRLTGYRPEEVLGKRPALFNSGRQGAPFYRALWAALERDKAWQGEIWNRRKNGKIEADWLSISAVLAPDGRVTHYVGAYSRIPGTSAED